jgi:ubiquitin carboxyl-terminal hydrolase 7
LLNGYLRYVGRLFVKASEKPSDILPKLREMAGFSHEEEAEFYEEIRFEPLVMCEYIDNSVNFQSSEVQSVVYCSN